MQGKVGLNFDLCDALSIFAEYRGLYLTNNNYSFGSTVYATHPVTSNWWVNMSSQYYNLGVLGIHYAI